MPARIDRADDRGSGSGPGPQPSDYRVVSTAGMPNWHTPFRCTVLNRWPHYDERSEWPSDRVAEYDKWLRDNPEAMEQCWYHRQGYERAMPLAIHAMRTVWQAATWGSGPDGDERSISDAIVATLVADPRLDLADVQLAGVLVAEPIIWGEGLDYVTDGQHRMCVLKAADVPEVLVCAR